MAAGRTRQTSLRHGSRAVMSLMTAGAEAVRGRIHFNWRHPSHRRRRWTGYSLEPLGADWRRHYQHRREARWLSMMMVRARRCTRAASSPTPAFLSSNASPVGMARSGCPSVQARGQPTHSSKPSKSSTTALAPLLRRGGFIGPAGFPPSRHRPLERLRMVLPWLWGSRPRHLCPRDVQRWLRRSPLFGRSVHFRRRPPRRKASPAGPPLLLRQLRRLHHPPHSSRPRLHLLPQPASPPPTPTPTATTPPSPQPSTSPTSSAS